MTSEIACITVGVADMQSVSDLWVDQLGLEVLEQYAGADSDLGAILNIAPDRITDQLLLGTPGARTGRLHFVQFSDPHPAVRADAAPYDLGPKNIDVNCDDMPERVRLLKDVGHEFRSEIAEYTLDDIHAREVQMPAHDGLNVVLIEVLSPGYETPYTKKGFAAVTSFVVIVQDTQQEEDFYRNLFGFKSIMQHRIAGPEIEKIVGLPPGSALDVRVCGQTDNMFGRMELVSYEGLLGTNRFSATRAPATGILNCIIEVSAIDEFATRAKSIHINTTEPVWRETIYGSGKFSSLESPAGLPLHIFSRG